MWTTWVIISLVQMYTTRYWKHYWRWNKLIHSILGFFSLALVTTAGFLALKTGDWTINSQSSKHSKAGFWMFVMSMVLMLGGILANIARLYFRMEWKTKWIRWIGKAHRWFGWGVILGSQVAVITGLLSFYNFNG